nr:hypothetical protein [Tanacetum cinerariifolium]
ILCWYTRVKAQPHQLSPIIHPLLRLHHHTITSLIPLPSIPTVTQTDTTPIIQYSRSARIAQSSALPTVADEPASPGRDDSQGEACPTDSGFIADQDRATIAKSSTLPHDSAPRVTSYAAGEGMVPFPLLVPLLLLFPLPVKLVPLLVQQLKEEKERKF